MCGRQHGILCGHSKRPEDTLCPKNVSRPFCTIHSVQNYPRNCDLAWCLGRGCSIRCRKHSSALTSQKAKQVMLLSATMAIPESSEPVLPLAPANEPRAASVLASNCTRRTLAPRPHACTHSWYLRELPIVVEEPLLGFICLVIAASGCRCSARQHLHQWQLVCQANHESQTSRSESPT